MRKREQGEMTEKIANDKTQRRRKGIMLVNTLWQLLPVTTPFVTQITVHIVIDSAHAYCD